MLQMYALVEYDTVEAAEKAVSSNILLQKLVLSNVAWNRLLIIFCSLKVVTLNDEMDWRNGLRVQLLQKQRVCPVCFSL